MLRGMLILAATLAAFLGIGGVSDDAEIRGRVVKVADGDTLTILEHDSGRARTPAAPSPSATQHKIRLYGIGVPEKSKNARTTERLAAIPAARMGELPAANAEGLNLTTVL